MSYDIREFRPSDYLHARALWSRTPGIGLSAADEEEPVLRYLHRNPGTSFVAVDATRHDVIGTLLCGHDGRRGLIHHLAVADAFRRLGVGRGLVRAGLAALAQQGIGKCHLLVFAENAAGLAFWTRCGAQGRTELQLLSLAAESAA